MSRNRKYPKGKKKTNKTATTNKKKNTNQIHIQIQRRIGFVVALNILHGLLFPPHIEILKHANSAISKENIFIHMKSIQIISHTQRNRHIESTLIHSHYPILKKIKKCLYFITAWPFVLCPKSKPK